MSKLSFSFLFFILLFFVMNFEKSLAFFPIFKSSTPSLISITIYLCIRKLNYTPSNVLLFFLGLLHDVISSVNLGLSSIFFLLVKLFTENLTIFNLNKNNQQLWFAFTIIFILTFILVLFVNVLLNLYIPDLNPLLFHIGTTLILFPIINAILDLFFFLTRLIKFDA